MLLNRSRQSNYKLLNLSWNSQLNRLCKSNRNLLQSKLLGWIYKASTSLNKFKSLIPTRLHSHLRALNSRVWINRITKFKCLNSHSRCNSSVIKAKCKAFKCSSLSNITINNFKARYSLMFKDSRSSSSNNSSKARQGWVCKIFPQGSTCTPNNTSHYQTFRMQPISFLLNSYWSDHNCPYHKP